jgi:hypothetical protein
MDDTFNFLKKDFQEDLTKLLDIYNIEIDFNLPSYQLQSCIIQYLLSLKLGIQGYEIFHNIKKGDE